MERNSWQNYSILEHSQSNLIWQWFDVKQNQCQIFWNLYRFKQKQTDFYLRLTSFLNTEYQFRVNVKQKLKNWEKKCKPEVKSNSRKWCQMRLWTYFNFWSVAIDIWGSIWKSKYLQFFFRTMTTIIVFLSTMILLFALHHRQLYAIDISVTIGSIIASQIVIDHFIKINFDLTDTKYGQLSILNAM
jgi:hypothetical protein